MPTVIVLHDVDDVDHWLDLTEARGTVWAPAGSRRARSAARSGSNHVGLVAEIPDMRGLAGDASSPRQAPTAMKFDGVRPETIRILMEG